MKREIIIEIERVRVIYNRRNRRLKWCAFCRAEVVILTMEEARGIAGIDAETMSGIIGEGRIHLYQTPADDSAAVCLNSLLDIENSHFRR